MSKHYCVRGRKIVFLCLLVPISSLTANQDLNAGAYTDQQLLAAGWTMQQVAELRAATAEKPKTNNKTKPVETELKESPYVSVFDDYRSFEYLPEKSWREANDEVGRIGGWRTYTRQVQEQQKQEAMAEDKEKK